MCIRDSSTGLSCWSALDALPGASSQSSRPAWSGCCVPEGQLRKRHHSRCHQLCDRAPPSHCASTPILTVMNAVTGMHFLYMLTTVLGRLTDGGPTCCTGPVPFWVGFILGNLYISIHGMQHLFFRGGDCPGCMHFCTQHIAAVMGGRLSYNLCVTASVAWCASVLSRGIKVPRTE